MIMQRNPRHGSVAVLEPTPEAPAAPTPTVAAPPRRPSAGFLTGSGGALVVLAIVLFATFYGGENATPAVAEAKAPYQVTLASGTIVEVDPIANSYRSVQVPAAEQVQLAELAQAARAEQKLDEPLELTTAEQPAPNDLIIEGVRPPTNQSGVSTGDALSGPPAVFPGVPSSCNLPRTASFRPDGLLQFPGITAVFVPNMQAKMGPQYPPFCGWIFADGSGFGGWVGNWRCRPGQLPVPPS